jgi:hypothetical protein
MPRCVPFEAEFNEKIWQTLETVENFVIQRLNILPYIRNLMIRASSQYGETGTSHEALFSIGIRKFCCGKS